MKIRATNNYHYVRLIEVEEPQKQLSIVLTPTTQEPKKFALVEVLHSPECAPGTKLIVHKRLIETLDIPGFEDVQFIPTTAVVLMVKD